MSESYTCLVVPAVEKEHAESTAGIDRVAVYFEYPGQVHPMERVKAELLHINASSARVAADHDGAWEYWGYRGPRLSGVLGVAGVADGEPIVESLRRVKSRAELECIQLACDWAGRAHRRMQAAIRTGVTEIECYAPAALETLREMVREMPGWRPKGFDGDGLEAMFVAGRKTAMPHGFVRGQGLQPGDTVVSGAGADIDGYRSELERTMFIGEPAAAQRAAFAAMLALQRRALEVMRPGMEVGDVERQVEKLAREMDRESQLRHHVGHSIGLEGHEAPFLDRGDDAVLEPGMVFTVEPGVYLPKWGGFRHSDTVVVTDSGVRLMTDYPRDLASLVIA